MMIDVHSRLNSSCRIFTTRKQNTKFKVSTWRKQQARRKNMFQVTREIMKLLGRSLVVIPTTDHVNLCRSNYASLKCVELIIVKCGVRGSHPGTGTTKWYM